MTTESHPPAPAGRLPLSGVRVIDLTLARAGPTCTRHLADWGADVVRIEAPGQIDALGGPRDGFDQINLMRNKRAIALDLKHPAGLAALHRLVKTADVVVENMRVQVKHRLKVAYDDLKVHNPRLVYASISGFGQDGPYADRAGVDQIAQGMGGLMSITGQPEHGPMRVGIAIADTTAGNMLAMAILLKLYERERTGEGGYVHTSLLESMIFMLDFQAARWLIAGEVAPQVGNDHPTASPLGVFPTADKPINIGASTPRQWETFAQLAGHPEWLQNPAWATGQDRARDRSNVNAAVAAVTRTRSSQAWVEALNEAGIPAGPINDIREVFEDPQVRHTGQAWPLASRVRGEVHVVGSPIHVEGAAAGVRRDAPHYGEHNDEVLAEAGFSAVEIQALKDLKVLLS